MPYKYIGRTTDFKGKTLWDIVGNLKNFGVGRIVVRSRFERYPEPSYMKIVKVESQPYPVNPSYDNVRYVKIWVERVFRGKTDPELVPIIKTSTKSDYRLIPKDEEESYYKGIVTKVQQKQEKILPNTMAFPPLLKELIIRDRILTGDKTTEEPRLKIVYNVRSSERKYRIAKAGETPTFEFPADVGTPVSPHLYEGIK